jgi:hypothetical protein
VYSTYFACSTVAMSKQCNAFVRGSADRVACAGRHLRRVAAAAAMLQRASDATVVVDGDYVRGGGCRARKAIVSYLRALFCLFFLSSCFLGLTPRQTHSSLSASSSGGEEEGVEGEARKPWRRPLGVDPGLGSSARTLGQRRPGEDERLSSGCCVNKCIEERGNVFLHLPSLQMKICLSLMHLFLDVKLAMHSCRYEAVLLLPGI